MADLTSIISGAINDTLGSDTSGGDSHDGGVDESISDPGSSVGAGDTSVETQLSPSASIDGTADPASGTTEAPAVVDQLTKDLEDLGLKAPKEGERENRLPHSRVKKIAENYGKKVEAKFTTELTDVRAKLAASEANTQIMNNINHLIDTDPDAFMERLSTVNPIFKKYLPSAAAPEPAKQVAPVASTPKPGPDMQFEDGSTGYSPEGLDKLLAWNADQAVTQALAKADEALTKRFGPIEQRWKTDQVIAEKLPGIRAQIASAKETWGKAFEDDHNLGDKSEILQLMKANPNMPFETAVARVLVPKTRVDANAMRASILKEINTARPAAAAKTGASPTGAGTTAGPRSLEDVIRESMATLK